MKTSVFIARRVRLSRRRCLSWLSPCTIVAIFPLSLVGVVLSFIFFEGRPFVDTCRYGWYGDDDFGIALMRARTITKMISAIVVEAPSAAWFLSAASTPYLKQVSRYVGVKGSPLWAYFIPRRDGTWAYNLEKLPRHRDACLD